MVVLNFSLLGLVVPGFLNSELNFEYDTIDVINFGDNNQKIDKNSILGGYAQPSSNEIWGEYYYNHHWENTTLDQWNFTDDYSYVENFLLNNGTDDVWVNIQVDNNLTYSNAGETKYFTFEIFDDRDRSVLSNWDGNITGFEAINWQGYQNYYWGEYGDEWADHTDPSLNDPDPYFEDEYEEGYTDVDDSETIPEDWDVPWTDPDPYASDMNAYDIMRESLNGDESWWFVNIYFEQWADSYLGTTNYTWTYVDTGENFDPNTVDLNSVSGYEMDWDIAQWMLTNETYNENNNWAWFSYDIMQWVSWYDVVSDATDFFATTTSFTGMSIYEDSNENGIAEAFYEYSEEYGILMYDQNDSEYLYYLNIESIENMDFSINESSDSDNLEFTFNIEGVQVSAVPFSYDYYSFMFEDPENYTTDWNAYYLEEMTLECIFEPKENASTLSIKHSLSDFLYADNHTSAIEQFEGMGITLDYSISSYQFSNIVEVDEPMNSYGFASVGVDGEVGIQTNETTLMDMNLRQKYRWGKDGKEYWNTVSLTPIYGFSMNYGGLDMGMVSEYSAQLAPYSYSLCFGNWEGFAVEMDPTFTSYFTSFGTKITQNPPQNWWITQIIFAVMVPLIAIFGIIMSKQEYRDFLLNRVIPLETGVHRLSMEDVLENENRSRVIDLIVDNPGIHFSELLRQTHIAPGNLNWHIEILERYKIIKNEIVGKYVMYFPYHGKNLLSNIDLKLQKSKTTMEILKIIQTIPGLTQNQIAKRIEKNHKTVKYHLDKLIEVDLIEKRPEGRKNLLYPTIEEPEEV